MKTTQLFNAAKIFSLASVVFFTACSEAEDPVPETPQQDTTTTGGLPNGGNTGGLPGGGNGGNNGGGNGPLGGGGNQPTTTNTIGMLTAGGSTYDFTGFSHAAEGDVNDQGKYTISLGYYDEKSAEDDTFDLFDTGNTAFFVYNAAQAGIIETGSYQYSVQNANATPFQALFFGSQGYGYLLVDGTVKVEATQNANQLLISITGNIVEVDAEFNALSEELIEIEAQFLTLARPEINARLASTMNIATTPISIESLR